MDEDFDGEPDDFDEDDIDDEEEEDEQDAQDYRDPRTVCHFCGGVGEIAHPVLGIIGGVPRTVNAGRVCPLCEGASALPGLCPPL